MVKEPPDQLVKARDDWLSRCKMTVDRYTKTVLQSSKQVDCFFLLCVVYKFGTHMALVHMDSIWSTCRSSVFRESNLMLAQTINGFREVLHIKDDIQLYETLGDTSCLDTLWTNQPPTFVALVVDPYGHAEDAGYRIQPGQEPEN